MNIIGISIGEHCSVSYIKNKQLIFASYEERFHRKKCLSGFPYKALDYLLKNFNLKVSVIDFIAIINTTTSGLEFSAIQRFNSFSVKDYIFEANNYYYPILFKKKKIKLLKLFKKKISKSTYPKKIINILEKYGENIKNSKNLRIDLTRNYFQDKKIPIHFIDHHFSHAVYGYVSCPKKLKKTLIFTADSMGDDGSNSNVYIFEKKKLIKKIFSSGKHNLGKLFRNITLLLGMKPYQHEYKVMGLAPYSSKEYSEIVKNIFKKYMYKFDKDWIFKKKPRDNYFTFLKELQGFRFDQIAGGLQSYFEEMLLDWFEFFIKKNKDIDSIIFSGGLSMNVKANLKIQELCNKYKIFFFVAPSGDDYSHAIGSAYACYFQQYEKKISTNLVNNLDCGYYFSTDDQLNVLKWAKRNGWKILKYKSKLVAEHIKKNKIIALCHGKAEFGARSLGFRSIIANPKDIKNLNKINKAIKSRDFWMPFAPSILDGKENLYLEFGRKFKDNYRYMACCANTSLNGRNSLSASIHPYDFTARPQIVKKKNNLMFYEIINDFGKISNLYAVLNTSLNIHGYPIVNNFKDLIFVLSNSKLDGCVMEDYFIYR